MRVQNNARGSDRKNGLAGTMKLVIAVMFTLVFALLNITEPKPHTATLSVSETANALAPAETEKPKQTDAPAAPQPKPFDANDSSTWPKCADGQIVRADNGQCDTPAAAPQQPTVAAAAPAPVSSNEAKAFIYQKESGNRTDAINPGSGACGLGQALPCSKLPCSLSDYACQDAWFTNYAMQRYGSWENARAFWQANKWW